MSDIHGRFADLKAMLSVISFSEADDLYILGDIIDRGPETAGILMWAVDEAPANIHFLAGNHEDLMLGVARRDPDELSMSPNHPWAYNGGYETSESLLAMSSPEWRRYAMLPWLERLLPYKEIDVGGRPFMLVHAGFEPANFPGSPEGTFELFTTEFNLDPSANQNAYDLGAFGVQRAQDMLWARDRWLCWTGMPPMDVIFGHTYIGPRQLVNMEAAGTLNMLSGGGNRIAHIGERRHCIDCGGSYSYSHFEWPVSIACLRLDDMAEFYLDFERTPPGGDPYGDFFD